MAVSFVPWQDEALYGSEIIKRSLEALADDLLFLFERLNVRVCLAGAFMEDQHPAFPRDLLHKICASLPLSFSEHLLPKTAHEGQVRTLIESLNHTQQVNGIIVDLPANHYLLNLIDPLKDVRLNNEDYLKLKKLDLSPPEEDFLSILMILEKTFDAAVDQSSKRRGYPL